MGVTIVIRKEYHSRTITFPSAQTKPSGSRARDSLLQPKRKFPAATAFPVTASEVLNVVSGRKPIMTDQPAEDPL